MSENRCRAFVGVTLVTETSSPTRKTTAEANKEIDQKDDDKRQQHHQLDVLPPHPPLECPRPDPKVARILAQPAGLVDQHTHVLASLQHALNVLRHDLSDALNLALSSPERILLTGLRTTLLDHHPLQRAIETRTSIRRQVVEIRASRLKLGKELLLEVCQEAKRYALAEVALSNDKESQAASCRLVVGEVRGRFDEAVDEELGLIDSLVGGFVVGDAWEDEGDERGGV